MIWCEYASADVYRTYLKVPVLLDDFLGGKAFWRMRSPYRDMKGPSYRLRKQAVWFADKVSMYVWPRPVEAFKLRSGRHRLTLRMTPKMPEFHHKISRIWITNDHFYRPQGWNRQADFKKSRLRPR